MYMKVCPCCKRPSYSSCVEKSSWICPYCGTDITKVPATADLREIISASELGQKSNKTANGEFESRLA